MAIACDFRVGGANTSFRFPEVSFGIIPGANGTQRLLALTGTAKARELVFLCRTVKGEEAYRIGLLTRLVDDGDVLSEAYNLAGELITMPGKALAAAKRAIIEGTSETLSDGKKTEFFEACLLFDTNDQKEGMAAFMEKRKPEFTNS
jgi:enoyl-CoA hydratase